jgi:site-specific recombinase XerD
MTDEVRLQAVPRTPEAMMRFGGGDAQRAKLFLLALYGFLESKPENTRRAYQRGIREFFELWDWISPESVGVAEAAYYKRWLQERGLSDATICLRLAACQSYFEFLMQPAVNSGKQLIPSNPFRLVTRKDCTPTPYGRSTPTEWADFEKVLNAIPDDPVGKRDKALLIFFANTGRRRAEAARLKVKDLNLSSTPRTYIARTKGNKLQRYELSDVCHAAIVDHWISSNRLTTLTPESSVFGPVRHGPGDAHRDVHRCLTVDQVAKILKTNVRRAGLDPSRFKLHGLRHMFAHDMDAAGARLQDIQASLGHANVGTTQIYTGKLRGPASVGVQKQLDEVRARASREAMQALDD